MPQLWLDVDRVKAKTMNVPLSNIFGTLQTYLGSSYVNDLTLFGRTYRVIAQADAQFRLDARRHPPAQDAQRRRRHGPARRRRRRCSEISGADKVVRYNMWPAADLNGAPAPGFSTGQAMAAVEKLAKENLPTSFTTEWTEMALQQKLAGNSALYIFPLCVLFVFLVLAAQYESWALPLAIILIVPMCLLSAIGGVWLRDMDNNIFTQIGFVVLVGLACKNAILIVEFAKQIQDRDGVDRFDAAVEACQPASAPDPDDQLRLHPRRAPARHRAAAPAPKCARRSAPPSSSACSASPSSASSSRPCFTSSSCGSRSAVPERKRPRRRQPHRLRLP